MHDGLLDFLKHVGPLLRVLRLLTLQNPFKQFPLAPEFKSPMINIPSEYHNFSDIHPDLCSDGVVGWRYYFYLGYKSSQVATFSTEC